MFGQCARPKLMNSNHRRDPGQCPGLAWLVAVARAAAAAAAGAWLGERRN